MIGLVTSIVIATSSQADSDPFANLDESSVQEVVVKEAKDGPERWYGEGYPVVDRAIVLPFGETGREGALRFFVDHRTNRGISDEPFHNLLGFDAGSLKIGLGLRYGVFDNLEMGVYRLSGGPDAFDTYEFDAKLQVLEVDRHGVDAAVRGGLSWFSQLDEEDAFGGFGQLLLSRRLLERLTLGTGLLFHSDSSNGIKSDQDDSWTLGSFATAELRINSWFAIDAEMSFAFAGYTSLGSEIADIFPSVALGTKLLTSRHSFTVVITNNQYTSSDGYITNTPRDFEDWILGFSITREWNL